MDTSQLKQLYHTYGYYVYKRCLRLLGVPADAEDALQDVFLKIAQSESPAPDVRGLLPWVNRIVTNHCFNVLRSAKVRGRYAEQLKLLPEDDHGALMKLAERNDLAAWLLAAASDEYRQAAVLYFIEELGVEQVAASLGVSVPTVRRRLRAFVREASSKAAAERAGITWVPSMNGQTEAMS